MLQLERTVGILPLIDKETVFHFIMVGAGGTGGHLAPNLIRAVSLSNKSREERKHTVTIVDKDEVEPKNLVRQHFSQNDIGKNKAEVLAKRYSKAYSQPVSYIPEYINSPKDLYRIMNNIVQVYGTGFLTSGFESVDENTETRYSEYFSNYVFEIPVIIDCTDNNKTRLIIHHVFKEFGDRVGTIFSLSSGNEEHSGQVVFGINGTNIKSFRSAYISIEGLTSNTKLCELPDFFEVFPNAKLDKLPDELSCAEAAISAPQNIGANINAANILFDYVNKLLNGVPITEHIVFFDIHSMARSVYQTSKEGLFKSLSLVRQNGYREKYLSGLDVEDLNIDNFIYAPKWEDVLKQRAEEKKAREKEIREALAGSVDVILEKEEETSDITLF